MIYFMQPTCGGPVKIGCTNDLPTRHKALESRYGQQLAILATMEGDRADEAEPHARFSHLRLGRTEQFKPGPDLMNFIDMPLFVNQGSVELMPPAIAVNTTSIPCKRIWKDWLERYAAHRRVKATVMIDLALSESAARDGSGPPPPRL